MKQLVELPVVFIEHQDVSVALRLWTAFDGGIRRDRIRAGITLIRVFKGDGHLWLIAADNVIRNPAGLTFPPQAKVLMQPRFCDDGIAQWIDFVFGDIAIPFIIRRHEQSATEIDIRACFELWLLCKGAVTDGNEKEDWGFHHGSGNDGSAQLFSARFAVDVGGQEVFLIGVVEFGIVPGAIEAGAGEVLEAATFDAAVFGTIAEDHGAAAEGACVAVGVVECIGIHYTSTRTQQHFD
jgi:hypothetical protein